MSDSRTHEASARRLARARQQSGRPSSQEIAAACALGAVAIGLPSLSATLSTAFRTLWADALSAAGSPQLSASRPQLNVLRLSELLQSSATVLAAVALTAGAATWLQRGIFVRFAGAAGVDRDLRVPPERWLERVGRAGISLVKWSVLIAALAAPWSDAVRGMLGAAQRAPQELLPIAGRLVVVLLERAAIVLAVLGAIDFGVQQAMFRRRLRMSRYELQEERRATEADPNAAAERRRRARELQAAVTLQELEEVSIVVCDLEGGAVAIRETAEATVVWLRVEAVLAARLRAEAVARAIPVVVDPDLTAALVAFEIGEPLSTTVRDHLRKQTDHA